MRVRKAVWPLVALALTGCAADTSQLPSQVTPQHSPSWPVSVPPVPRPPTFRYPPVSARGDVQLTSCATEAGHQRVRGTILNSAAHSRDYAIIVLWLRNDSGTPFGSTLIIVRNVTAGTHRTFEATTTVVARADKCVIDVTAGHLR